MQSASTNKSAKDTANSAELKVWPFVCVCVCVCVSVRAFI